MDRSPAFRLARVDTRKCEVDAGRRRSGAHRAREVGRDDRGVRRRRARQRPHAACNRRLRAARADTRQGRRLACRLGGAAAGDRGGGARSCGSSWRGRPDHPRRARARPRGQTARALAEERRADGGLRGARSEGRWHHRAGVLGAEPHADRTAARFTRGGADAV